MTETDMPPQGDEPDPTNPPPDPTEPPPGDPDEESYPPDTAPADMSPEDAVKYWRTRSRQNERLWRARANEAREEADRLRRENMSERERAIEDARTQARNEALGEMNERLVESEISAFAAARGIADDVLERTLGAFNRSWFLTDDGDVDRDKVREIVGRLAATQPATGDSHWPDLAQGRRPRAKRESAAERGLAEARRRFGTAS